MNEDELRALIRDAVRRHLGGQGDSAPAPAGPETPAIPAPARDAVGGAVAHVSHALYMTLVNPDDTCLVEPAVPCTHCGYCKSHGY